MNQAKTKILLITLNNKYRQVVYEDLMLCNKYKLPSMLTTKGF